MIAYVDASLLQKAYVRQVGSDAAVELVEAGTPIGTSRLTYAEVLATIQRKQKAGEITRRDAAEAVEKFRRDWADFTVVDLDRALMPLLDQLGGRFALKGADLAQLASASYLAGFVSLEETEFWSCDRELCLAAREYGFKVMPTEVA